LTHREVNPHTPNKNHPEQLVHISTCFVPHTLRNAAHTFIWNKNRILLYNKFHHLLFPTT
jgi:hypothetical protein